MKDVTIIYASNLTSNGMRWGQWRVDDKYYQAVVLPWSFFGILGVMHTLESETPIRVGPQSTADIADKMNQSFWMIINANTGRADLFGPGEFTDEIIREKLGLEEEDYPDFGDLIRELISFREK